MGLGELSASALLAKTMRISDVHKAKPALYVGAEQLEFISSFLCIR